MASNASRVTVTRLPSRNPDPINQGSPAHHIGKPPTSFQNPWESSIPPHPLSKVLSTRFGSKRNFVPVPANREGLVGVRKPDFGVKEDPEGQKLKATWIGHASWLIETGAADRSNGISAQASRGVRIALDPVFSERTSPFTFLGPKRYTPPPCTLEELPEIDAIVISHNHYDHLDIDTIKRLYRKQGHLHFFCGLGNKPWFLSLGIGIKDSEVYELDWWEGVELSVNGVGNVAIFCTPAQHFSSRTPFDRNCTLWASWVLLEGHNGGDGNDDDHSKSDISSGSTHRKVYFGGDTGYRTVHSPHPTPEEEAEQPCCPAFAEIGNIFGPFDLALIPIGLSEPRDFMSSVHCSPEDAICVHQDVKSKKSIGMHYGTVRGGVSAYYEDVRYPPRRFKEVCEERGFKWDEQVGLCDVGETILID